MSVFAGSGRFMDFGKIAGGGMELIKVCVSAKQAASFASKDDGSEGKSLWWIGERVLRASWTSVAMLEVVG